MRATASFSFDEGITTSSWKAMFALRIRVSMSAIGSVIIGCAPSPRRLHDTGDLARVRHLAQADTAQPEVAVDRARPAATLAAAVPAHLELRRLLRLVDECLLRHALTPGRRGGTGSRARGAARGRGHRSSRSSRW